MFFLALCDSYRENDCCLLKYLFLQEASSAKKSTLDSLSKEELIGRCKNLLQLAQKAKNAKDGRLMSNFVSRDVL